MKYYLLSLEHEFTAFRSHDSLLQGRSACKAKDAQPCEAVLLTSSRRCCGCASGETQFIAS